MDSKAHQLGNILMEQKPFPGHWEGHYHYKDSIIWVLSYKDVKIRIRIEWFEKYQTYGIIMITHTYRKYNRTSRTDGLNYTKKIDKIILHIKNRIQDAKEQIDKEEIHKNFVTKNLTKVREMIGVHIQKNNLSRNYYYKQGQTFKLDFQVEGMEEKEIDENSLFEIININGKVTLDEFKTILKIIGGNKRAIVERLRGKQPQD